MLILGIFERLGCTEAESFVYVHGLVEPTTQAFLVRNRRIHDTGARAIDWGLMFIGAVAVLGAASYIFILGDIKRIELPEAVVAIPPWTDHFHAVVPLGPSESGLLQHGLDGA